MCEIAYTPQSAAAQTVVPFPLKRGAKLGSHHDKKRSLAKKQTAMRTRVATKLATKRKYNSWRERDKRRRAKLRYHCEYSRDRRLILKMNSYLLNHLPITQEELDAEREFNRLHAVGTSCSDWREFNKFALTSHSA